jgi:hypothetical protein
MTAVFTRPLVFAVILTLVVIIIYGSFSMTDVSGRRMSSYFCNQLQSNPLIVECCAVDLDSMTVWCVECSGSEESPHNCSDPYISMASKPTPVPTPLGPLGIPEDGVLQQPPPASPLGPRPFTPQGEATVQQPPQTTPTPSPEDDQSDDGPGPFRGPLGGGVLQEPDDEPEDNGDNEEQEESSNEDKGSDTAGPLT